MPSLLELQEAFGSALLFEETAAIEPFVRANGLEPAARLRIYRNNARENFLATLQAAYPVLERLVGTEYFRQMGLQYMQRHPSPSGNLHHVGARLAGFLALRFEGTEYAYLAEVARLEWACQEVLVAADHEPLDLARLGAVPSESYARLVFRLHPAVRLVASRFPVMRIWSANQPGSDASERIDLASGGERTLVRRGSETVELRQLEAAEFAFLEGIARGEPLGAIADNAALAGFDLGAALRRYVGVHALVDFSLPEAPT